MALDVLEGYYGPQIPGFPTDPFRFLIWWHCGYPPSEDRCGRGWEALTAAIDVSPAALAAARSAALTRALRAGGLIPGLRATRVRAIARRVQAELAGDLRAALAPLSEADGRKLLREFPGIGAPGADRILLFAALAPVAAVPSSCPHVPVRIQSGREGAKYAATYAQARLLLEGQLPDTLAARSRAYLLLQRHGRQLCKSKNPQCSACPVAANCAYFANTRGSAAKPRPAARGR